MGKELKQHLPCPSSFFANTHEQNCFRFSLRAGEWFSKNLSIYLFSCCFLFHTDSLVWDPRYWQCYKIWCLWNILHWYIGSREKNKRGKKDEKIISSLRKKLYKTFCNEKIRKVLEHFYKAWLVSLLFTAFSVWSLVQSLCSQCKSRCCASSSQMFNLVTNNRG